MGITHSKVSAIGDGGDASLVRPSDWNAAHVGLPAFSGARVKESTADQTITTDTLTALTFDEEDYDVGGYHDTGSLTERLTAPATAYYECGGTALMTGALGTTDFREIRIMKGGVGGTIVAFWRGTTAGDNNTGMAITGQVQLNSGEYVVLAVQHSAGANRTVSNTAVPATFWIHALGT